MSTEKSVAGLFAGIGGLEFGLQASGFHAKMLCEISSHAKRVLDSNFPGVPIEPDVTELKSLPQVEILAAGFPCQDLSQAGGKIGISGGQSGLVSHLLRLVKNANPRPKWLLIENVSFMLRLDKGHAMWSLTSALEELGYRWAYRVVDARSFGVPQRRLRVILLASQTEDPRDVLFVDDVTDMTIVSHRLQQPLVIDTVGPSVIDLNNSYGFYWTEGRIGIGWTVNGVPTIKGGSGLGIPSPPAIWLPSTNEFGVPSIEDGERLQGFPAGWTASADSTNKASGVRWKLVGNAVCTKVSEWVGSRLASPGSYHSRGERKFTAGPWPLAAYGAKGVAHAVPLSVWPNLSQAEQLENFLNSPLKPLSHRAASGFLARAKISEKIRYSPIFIDALERYVRSF